MEEAKRIADLEEALEKATNYIARLAPSLVDPTSHDGGEYDVLEMLEDLESTLQESPKWSRRPSCVWVIPSSKILALRWRSQSLGRH